MPTPSDTTFARYLAGECSVEEAREIERWADEDPAHRARLEELRGAWEARRPSPEWDVPGIWANVQRSMRTERRRTEQRRSVPLGRALGWERERRWLSAPLVAAAAILLLAVGVSLLNLDRFQKSPAASAPAPMREYATARGQRARLQLSDGTRLVLAPASRLRIPATFGRGAREVLLEGEALFDVVHDTTRPFRVRAKDAVAEDLGTKFDVRAYPEDSVVAVAVAEGIVALGRVDTAGPADGGAGGGAARAQGVLLQAGELGTLGPAGQVTTARGAALANYLGWADGKLAFVDVPLSEVVTRLGRWYDVDVRLESPEVGTRRLTATLTGESAPEAVRFVASILNLTVTQAGQRYTLRTK